MKGIPPQMLPAILREQVTNLGARAEGTHTLPAPYAAWQRQLMAGKCRLMVFPCGTKSGKTLGGSVRMIGSSYESPAEQAARFRIIAPTYKVAGITFDYMCRLLPEKFHSRVEMEGRETAQAISQYDEHRPDRSESKMHMRWRHNRALISCVHAQDPETTLEGDRIFGNFIDEASKMDEQVFTSATSTTAQTGGWSVLCSTPRGKNYFYDLHMQCLEHMDWAKRTGKPLEMFTAVARTIDNPNVKPEIIEQSRRTLSDRMFRQLFLAEFLDNGSVFAGLRDVLYGEEIVIDSKTQAWQVPDSAERSVVIGADWARRQDYAVLVAWDVVSPKPRIIGFRRMRGVEYVDVIREAARFARKFKEVVLMRHDRTGIGDVIDSFLQNLPFPVDGVVFTNERKGAMVDSYAMAISTGACELPYWRDLVKEHDSFDCRVNALGKPTYNAIPGRNDDIVTACYLGWSAVLEARDMNLQVLDLQEIVGGKGSPDPDSIEGWYASLVEDADDDSREWDVK